MVTGAERARREGGATGRAAIVLEGVLREGAGDGEAVAAADTEDLMGLW